MSMARYKTRHCTFVHPYAFSTYSLYYCDLLAHSHTIKNDLSSMVFLVHVYLNLRGKDDQRLYFWAIVLGPPPNKRGKFGLVALCHQFVCFSFRRVGVV